MKKLIPLLLIGLVIFYFWKMKGSTPIEDFTAKDIHGEEIRLSDFDDQVVILDFWATWCPPCRAEIPHLVDLYKAHKDDPLEIISVALEKKSEDKAIRFTEDNKMNWVHIIDNQEGPRIAALYKVNSIPSIFVIKNGRIVASGLRGNALKQKVASLLK